jgi:hypothetical protein
MIGMPIYVRSEFINNKKGPIFKNYTMRIHDIIVEVSSDRVRLPLNLTKKIMIYLRMKFSMMINPLENHYKFLI